LSARHRRRSYKCDGIGWTRYHGVRRALAAGDPLGALKRVALATDAPALRASRHCDGAARDFARAKALCGRAARAFGAREAVARARWRGREAEIALASRDLSWAAKALDAARRRSKRMAIR